MNYVILAVIGWTFVFILIPFERIKQLILVPIIAFVWIVIVDHVSVSLDYYKYKHIIIPIGNASFFQSLAAAAVGLLMINWLTENPLSKLVSSVLVSAGLVALENIYIQLGAFAYGRFDPMLSILQSLAAFSIFIWATLAIVGQEKVYSGNKSRFHNRRFAHR